MELASKFSNKNDIFGDIYHANPNQFQFRPGDIKLIEKLVEHVKKIADGKGINSGLSHFNNKASNTATTTKALQGEDECSDTKTHYFLKKLISAANRNAKREKGGYRYDEDIKLYAAYLRMIIGPLAYETLQRNLLSSLPSLPSTNRYVRSSGCHVSEGILRCEELALYLKNHNLDPFVCISEDATRIVGKVQYDSKSNQLVGFVLPLNSKTGMPIPFVFPARSSTEIIKHFTSNNQLSSYLNVIMAQPLADIPPFCLAIFGSDNKYNSHDVTKRWNFISEKLAEANVKELTFASDSDPKFNSAMRTLSQLGYKTFIDWFSCCGFLEGQFFFQDIIHIATKLRNFFLRTIYDKRSLPFGKFFIRIEHIYELLNMFTKDKHQLTPSTLNPSDRQNFKSVLRLCHQRITILLKDHIKDSEGTIQFLQIIRDVVDSFMNPMLTPLQRTRKIWYSLFILRIWRDFIQSSKKYTLKDNFLTANCFSCIELNAHSMILCMLYLKQVNKPELFIPSLFESQPCENIFRQIRSLTSVYSTVTNCTVKETTSRISNIQFQNQIMQLTSKQFVYPRLKNPSNVQNKVELPSQDTIHKEIELCQKLAKCTAIKFGLVAENKLKQNYVCRINPTKTDARLKPVTKQNSSILNDSIELMANDFKNIQLKNYASKVNSDDISETSPYVEVECFGNRRVIVKKTSICWLLGNEHKKLSNDRLRRVMHTTHNASQPKLTKRLYSNPLLHSKKRVSKKRKR